MDDNKEVYRVGTLILHDDGMDYNIVDGQQRTITFSLLLKALGEDIIDFLNEKLAENEYNLHNVLNNYRAFERRLENVADKEKLKGFIETQCQLIVVITKDLSEAFQFFDSQNARGKALYPHDLLKAYHLREMGDVCAEETEKIVKVWEDADQSKLSELFTDYLYRLKEWLNGNYADELTAKNIDMFKGITAKDNYPYAQFFKGAFAYADNLNHSSVPFVTGSKLLKSFQINAPVIAGKPFFEYTKHYFELLTDIRCNDKYFGYFINGNEIVKTLDEYFNRRIGDKITRFLFDTAVLLYVDRFCPMIPSKTDMGYFDRFVELAFIWAYSMRAQYKNVGWLVAQNFVLGYSDIKLKNNFNIYRTIIDNDSPNMLISKLLDTIEPIEWAKVKDNKDNFDTKENDIFRHYLNHFDKYLEMED